MNERLHKVSLFVNLIKTQKRFLKEEIHPGFRTKTEDLIPKLPNKAKSEQVKAMFKNAGVTPEEIKWLDLTDILNKPVVSKDEIVSHLQSKKMFTDINLTRPGHSGEARYSDYALKGGKNYGERLFKLKNSKEIKWKPEEIGKNGWSSIESEDGKYVLKINREDGVVTSYYKIDNNEMKTIRTFYVDKILGRDLDKIIEFSKIKCKEHASEQSGGHYRHNHWGSESNMLFHVRHQEFKDADGKSVFFVEEIQSDWHQEGRKKGYKGGFKAEIKHEFPGDKFPYRVYIGGEKISAHETEDEAKASASDIEPRWNQNNGVPDAPMKKSWEENAFKYSLQQAVESGCDRIGWVTGDIAAERFDLSKQLDSVSAQKNPDGTYHIYGFKGESQILSHDSKEEDLDEVVGKEMAKKIIDDLKKQQIVNYSGLDLKIGGEGMKAAYDQRIVSIAKKIAKQGGSTVGKVKIFASTEGEEDGESGIKIIDQKTLDELKKYLDGISGYWNSYEREDFNSWGDFDSEDEEERFEKKQDKKEQEWNDADESWHELLHDAARNLPENANDIKSLGDLQSTLYQASKIEDEWGDDTSTRTVMNEIREILGWEKVRGSQLTDQLASYEDFLKKQTPKSDTVEIWYMDLTDGIKSMVKNGMRLAFESTEWWKIQEDDLSAWHGTANVDPYEKFDYNKVGGPGGEGAQAFGYGLYFTGKKAIAKWYRNKLSSVKSELFIDGKKASFHDNDPINMLIARAWTAIGKELGKNKKTLTKELKHNKSSAFKQWKQRFDQAIAKVQTDSVVIKTDMGKIYHVDIPEDNEYLDWDKPFSEQNPHVKLALETLFKKYKFEKFLDAVKKVDGGDSKALKEIGFSSFDYPNAAGSLYNKLAEVLSERGIKSSQKQVSDELKALGVPGIKYNGDGSKDGVNNYVIFDDSKIKIKKVHEWWEI